MQSLMFLGGGGGLVGSPPPLVKEGLRQYNLLQNVNKCSVIVQFVQNL